MRGYNHHKESFFGVRNNKLGADGIEINPIQSTAFELSKIDKKRVLVGDYPNTQPIISKEPLIVSPSIVDSATPSVLPSQPVGQHVETNDSTPIISTGVGGGFGGGESLIEEEMSTRPHELMHTRSDDDSKLLVSTTWLIVAGAFSAAMGIYLINK